MMRDNAGEFEAVHIAWHLNIGEHRRNVIGFAAYESQRGVGSSTGYDLETGVFQRGRRIGTQQRLVFNDETIRPGKVASVADGR